MRMIRISNEKYINPLHVVSLDLTISKRYEKAVDAYEQYREFEARYGKESWAQEQIKANEVNTVQPVFMDYVVTRLHMSDGSEYELDVKIDEAVSMIEAHTTAGQ